MVIVGIEPMIPGSLTNALLALEETDHNFIHSTKPMQKIKGMLGIKVAWHFVWSVLLLSGQKAILIS